MTTNAAHKPSNEDEVVRKALTVPLSPTAAFTLWTEQIQSWWPTGHSRSGDPNTCIVMETGVGGRFYERTSHGIEYEWGRILVWEPPYHLAYHWYLGSGPMPPTRVDVFFTAVTDGETLVSVEHRGPALIGDLWWLNNSRYRAAWDVVLPAYGRSASKQACA
ncbi:MAG: SRPBCC domain-containing protein [Caldilineaceae bacterium]|nr:SRPBCC domain-containing protein [Caldilineaceae bacterium]